MMPNIIQETELMKEVNPVFTTAQACLLVMAEAGNPEAKKLASSLGFDRGVSSVDKDAITDLVKFQKMKSIPGFATTIEARFLATNNLIHRRHERNIVDLPCGYTPRGLQLAQSDIAYYGMDLPPVIDAMRYACDDLQIQGLSMFYHS